MIHIKPTSSFSVDYFKEIFRYRDLFFTFVERDIKVRYKQTILGVLWAVMQPFLTMVVFSFFFGKLAEMPSDGLPYPIFSYAGLLLWMYFSTSLSKVSVSMTGNKGLITKVYFPRMIVPIAAALTPMVDYVIAFSVLIGMMVYYSIPISFNILLLPAILVLAFLLAVGLGLILASMNVRYRDVGIAIPFFIQLLLYITPVIYPASVGGRFESILKLNPLTGIMEAHRAATLAQSINYMSLSQSFLMVALILVIGVYFFRKMELTFADII